MNSEYKVSKFKLNNLNDFNDRISIEEPLEIIIKYNDKGIWVEKTISITIYKVFEMNVSKPNIIYSLRSLEVIRKN